MASCCACTNCETDKIAVSCLGRCDLPKHKCVDREDIGPGPVPAHLGWLYTAKDSPEHQLRCGWRPGHIFCPTLRQMEANSCSKCVPYSSCRKPPRCVPRTTSCMPRPRCYPVPSSCRPGPKYCVIPFPPVRPSRTVCGTCRPGSRCHVACSPRPKYIPCPSKTSCSLPCYAKRARPPKCLDPGCKKCNSAARKCPPLSPKKCYANSCGTCYPTSCRKCCHPTCPPSMCCQPCELPCNKPMIRIIRHNGKYSIITKPDNITNHPSGPYPLKYVIDTDEFGDDKDAKFTIEAKFNDQHFDYTSSQSSFVLDFSPPDPKCIKPCPKRSTVCFPCQNEDGLLACPECAAKTAPCENKCAACGAIPHAPPPVAKKASAKDSS
ncbi:hypothetical protein O0L34_g13837 [Tuta absoluta]|nr:hypothetical protein O0L34_g13837 [Tuta absoluta]